MEEIAEYAVIPEEVVSIYQSAENDGRKRVAGKDEGGDGGRGCEDARATVTAVDGHACFFLFNQEAEVRNARAEDERRRR